MFAQHDAMRQTQNGFGKKWKPEDEMGGMEDESDDEEGVDDDEEDDDENID